jgi:hypothetical protein
MEPLAEYRQLLKAQACLSGRHPMRKGIDQRVEDLGNNPMLWSYNCIICRQPVTFELTISEANEWTAPPMGVCGGCAR